MWIKCCDQMPPCRMAFLAYGPGVGYDGIDIEICEWDGKHLTGSDWCLSEDRLISNGGLKSIWTHWMPLPDKPEAV